MIASLCAMLGGCLTLTVKVPPEKLSQYKRIGVLSAMGDDFQTSTMGFMIFNNEQETIPLDIGTDEMITWAFEKALSPRYAVIDLSRYRQAFMATPSQWPGQGTIFDKQLTPAADVVRSLKVQENLDAYLVITPDHLSSASDNDLMSRAKGIGIWSVAGLLGMKGRSRFHAAFTVGVVDAQDFAVVARQRPKDPAWWSGSKSPFNNPNAAVPYTWKDQPAEYREEIRQETEKLINQTVPRTLNKFGFIE